MLAFLLGLRLMFSRVGSTAKPALKEPRVKEVLIISGDTMAIGSKHNSVISGDSSVSILSKSASLATTLPSGHTVHPMVNGTTTTAPSSTVVVGTKSKRALLPCKSGNGRSVNRWRKALNALKSHSSRPLKIDNIPLVDPMESESYICSWIAKHPSALKHFDQAMERANGKQVVVFLDYDGTLSPIVQNPDHAFMSDKMRAVVKAVALLFPTAIISGRCREKVYEFVQLPELYYAGSHGMDIMGPAEDYNGVETEGTRALDMNDNDAILFQLANDLITKIEEVCQELSEKTKLVEGVRIENNKFCASVHFRCVKDEEWDNLAELVESIMEYYPNLCLKQGRKVLEIRPTIAWNKGKALEFLLNVLGLGGRNDVFPIYIGDDRTDEDAFRVLKKKGQGLSILVSNDEKDTSALCSLRDPSEVMQFLERLPNWKASQPMTSPSFLNVNDNVNAN